MKRLITFSLLLPLCVPSVLGQGTLYLSNLGQPTSTTEHVSSTLGFGALFHTGTNPEGYELNSVQLLMSPASGGAAGFAVSIFTYDGGLPGSSIGNLTGPDPSAGGTFSYSAAGLFLSPSTLYFIVATATSPVSEGYYNWNRSSNSTFASSEGWLSGLGYYYYNGTDWNLSRSSPLQFSITATAIPEPSSLALLLIGGALVTTYRRRLRQDVGQPGQAG